MAITREKKEQLVEALASKIRDAKAIVFTDYKGLSVEEISILRNNLREKGIEFKVLKNSLFKIAIKNSGTDISVDLLNDHPIGAAFSYKDEVEAAKIIYEFAKKHEAIEFVGGVLNGKAVDVDQVKILALMPGREEMYARVVGSLASPLRGLVNVVQGNLRGLVNVLDQYQKKIN